MARRRAVELHSADVRRAPLVDPRDGDIEADASSTESRSLLAIAGNLLVEVSLPKFAIAFCLLVVLPALLLGITPVLASVWWSKVSANGVRGTGAIVFLMFLLAVGWFGGRKLFRLVEGAFWSLNAMVIQPGYVTVREGLLHLGGRITGAAATEDGHVLDPERSWYIDDAIPPDSAAAIVLLEHRWAIGLRDAVRDAGGFHLADAWVHPTDLVAIGELAGAESTSA